MNYLYLVFELGRTAKTSRAPRMFRVEDALSAASPTTHFSALCAVNCLGDISQSETLFCTYICDRTLLVSNELQAHPQWL